MTRLLRRRHLVEPSDRRRVGRAAGDLGVLGGLFEDCRDRLREGVERLLRLGLGGLHHQRLVDEQREVDGGRVEAEVEQPLGEVERLDLQGALHRPARQHELVHAQLAVGHGQLLGDAELAQPREQVVGVQHRRLGRIAQTVGAERADVGVGAHEAAVVAVEAAQAPDRLGADIGAAVVELERPVGRARDDGHRQVRRDALGHGDRTGPRAAAPVRLGERLVQVEVDDVEAHVARDARSPSPRSGSRRRSTASRRRRGRCRRSRTMFGVEEARACSGW